MRYIILLLLFLFPILLFAQPKERLPFLQPADTLHKGRFYGTAAAGAITYTAVMIGLNEVWYSDYERSGFHLFNDMGEWRNMDKMGHTFTAYFEAQWVYKGARWTGLEDRKSIWLGVALGSLFQASVETLDGFSAKWGFSVPDIAFNTLGVSIFATQQLVWEEQRILLKVSSYHKPYPDISISSVDGMHSTFLRTRTEDLYGGSYAARFLKDYNALNMWASVNIHSFLKNKNSKIPVWLNVAVGYGAENLYGGFRNEWEEDGVEYLLGTNDFPRYQQFYLSLDIDLSKVKTKSRFLKSLFTLLNVIKIPAPTLEVNTLGKVKFYPIYF